MGKPFEVVSPRIILAQADTPPAVPDAGSATSPAEPAPTPTPTPPAPPANPLEAKVWTDGNRVSSDGKTSDIFLTELPADAKELSGTYAMVSGKTQLNGVFKWEPYVEGSKVTQDGFDQAQLFYSLTSLSLYLKDLGLDPKLITSKKHGDETKSHPIKAFANSFDDLNAYYDPDLDGLFFGTDSGKWHLASDSDVTNHEAGHLLLDHLNQDLGAWYSNHGRAIHEGFGDMLASFKALDPEISEDFPPAEGAPDDKDKGLRTVKHNLKLSDVSEEDHDRGQVYGGFFWSVMEKLTGPPYNKTMREAADIMTRVAFKHADCYKTKMPDSKDFVRAMIEAASQLDTQGKLGGIPRDQFLEDIKKEAIARGMIRTNADIEEPAPPWSAGALQGDLEDKKVIALLARTNPKMSFTETKKAKGMKSDFQEWYTTGGGMKVKVLGAGFVSQLSRRAGFAPQNVASKRSLSDVRLLTENNIDEGTAFGPQAAISKVRRAIERSRTDAEKELQGPLSYNARIRANLDHRIAETAMARIGRLTEKDAQVTILPGEKELYYEINVGMALCYVNAKTGKVMIKPTVFWN